MRKLNLVSASFKQLQVPSSLLPSEFGVTYLVQVHGTILSALTGVDWEWRNAVSDMTGPAQAPAGSVFELDLG